MKNSILFLFLFLILLTFVTPSLSNRLTCDNCIESCLTNNKPDTELCIDGCIKYLKGCTRDTLSNSINLKGTSSYFHIIVSIISIISTHVVFSQRIF